MRQVSKIDTVSLKVVVRSRGVTELQRSAFILEKHAILCTKRYNNHVGNTTEMRRFVGKCFLKNGI